MDLDPEFVRRSLDPLPRSITLLVADSGHLIETGDGVPHVAGILERLLEFLGECELLVG